MRRLDFLQRCAKSIFLRFFSALKVLLLVFLSFAFVNSALAHPGHEPYTIYFAKGGGSQVHADTADGACARWSLYYYYPGFNNQQGEAIRVEAEYTSDGRVSGYNVTCRLSAYNWLYRHWSSTIDGLTAYCNLPNNIYNTNFLPCQPEETGACSGSGSGMSADGGLLPPGATRSSITPANGGASATSPGWTSPADGRFNFTYNYRSHRQPTDQSFSGLGDGWSVPFQGRIERDYSDGQSRIVMFGDNIVHHFSGTSTTTPKSRDHGYSLDLSVAAEGARHVVTHADGQRDIYEDISPDVALLAEMRWPDGYAIAFSRDADNRVSVMEDNKGQRAQFTWDTTLNSDTVVPVITRIEVDTDYDDVLFAPDVQIDHAYQTDTVITSRLYLTGVATSELATNTVLSETNFSYDDTSTGTQRGLLLAVQNGLTGNTGQPFDFASFTYDSPSYVTVGRATSIQHTNGADQLTIGPKVATTNGYSVTVTNSLGKDTIYSYEEVAGQDRLVSVDGVGTTNCLPSNTTATHNADGRVIERVERNGARTVLTRDSEGRILTRTENADGAASRTTTYTWPSTGLRKPLTRTTAKMSETFTYDADALVTSYSQTDVLAGSPDLGKTRTWTYNYSTLASGLKVLTTVDGPGLVADGVNDVSTYTYDALGRLLTATDPNGLTQEVLAYGPSGQPTLIRNHQGFEWAIEYDLAGRMLSSTFEPGVLNEVTTYIYDIAGQMLSSTDPLGRTWGYTYDEAHRLIRITAPSGETITFTHDAMGNVTQTQYADATAIATYLEQTQYDELGRILQTLGSNGQTTGFTHDVEDNLRTITDATNLTTTNSYDALNRMTAIADRAGGVTTMGHDVDDQRTSYTDPQGVNTSFTYNGFGDLISEVSADRGTMTYSYNNRGMVTSMTDGRGVVTDYAYDDGGRLVSKTFPSDPTLDQSFVYHADPTQPHNLGMLDYVADETGETEFRNEPTRGDFHEEIRSIADAQYSIKYTRNAAGQVTAMEYPSGIHVLYTYDADGDLERVQWQKYDVFKGNLDAPKDVVSGMTYLPQGPLTSMTYGDGGVWTGTYDTSYRLTGITDIRDGIVLRDVDYAWTLRDNLDAITDNLDPGKSETYSYTPREFLASADKAGWEYDWLYDSVGNRTQQMSLVGGIAETDFYTYPADSHRLQSISLGSGGTRDLTYDGAGNVTGDNRAGQGYNYTYDAAGRMASFSINGAVQAQYGYNHLGQQVERRLFNSSQVLHSIHDAAGNRIAEYTYSDQWGQSFQPLREYIWANGQVVAIITRDPDTIDPGTIYYVRTDHIGKPLFATDRYGTKVWEVTYSPFGGVETTTGANINLRFPGQWFQSETGLHQNWMRDYDPTTGRYMQADPLGLVDGASVYNYVSQRPLVLVDPRGEQGTRLFTLPISPSGLGGEWSTVPGPPQAGLVFQHACSPAKLSYHPPNPDKGGHASTGHWHFHPTGSLKNRHRLRTAPGHNHRGGDHFLPGSTITIQDCSCGDGIPIPFVPPLILPNNPGAGGGDIFEFSPYGDFAY